MIVSACFVSLRAAPHERTGLNACMGCLPPRGRGYVLTRPAHTVHVCARAQVLNLWPTGGRPPRDRTAHSAPKHE